MRFWADTEEVFEHGMTALDMGKLDEKVRKEPTEKEREAIRCKCGYVLNVGDTVCPQCGHERRARSLVEHVPGELVEIDGTKANRTTSWDEKQKFIGGLRAYAREHGYQSGWVAHKYKSKFGVWPNDPRVRDVPAQAYGVDLSRWLKSQAIRFAKSRAAA